MKKAFYICSSACLAALAVCYGVWVSEQKDIGILSVVTSILVTLLFGVLLIWLVKAIIDAWFGKRDEDTVRPLLRTDGARRYEVLKVGAYILVSRFVVFLLVKAVNGVMSLGKKKEEEKKPTTKICPYCKSTIDVEAVKCPCCTSDL